MNDRGTSDNRSQPDSAGKREEIVSGLQRAAQSIRRINKRPIF